MKLNNLWKSLYSQRYNINFSYQNRIYPAKSYNISTGRGLKNHLFQSYLHRRKLRPKRGCNLPKISLLTNGQSHNSRTANSFFSFLKSGLLRCNLHTLKLSFLVYNSRGFDKCIQSCKHRHNQHTEQFYRLLKTFSCPFIVS